MQWLRMLLLPCLLATPAAADDEPRFAVEDVRAAVAASPSRSGRFASLATARAAAPAENERAARFKLDIAPECDPGRIFSNGFE